MLYALSVTKFVVPRLASATVHAPLTQRHCQPPAAMQPTETSSISTSSFKTWGSFHSPPVELLIRQSDSEYTPPHIPIDCDAQSLIQQQLTSPPRPSSPPPLDLPSASFTASTLSHCPVPSSLLSSPLLSHPLTRQLFHLSSSFTFINHGAFGSPLSSLTAIQHRWLLHAESQPLRFIDRQLLPLLAHATRLLAHSLHTQPTQLVLGHNVTTLLTAVVRSMSAAAATSVTGKLRLGRSWSVVRLSLAYGAVKRMVDELCSDTGTHMHEVHIRLPLQTAKDVVAAIAAAFVELSAAGRPASFLFVDHIASNTALLLPLPAILALCRQHDVEAIVDGAHGPWQLLLDLSSLDCAVYAGNLHKWWCGPKGAAFMYVSPGSSLQSILRSPVCSHGSGAGLVSDFLWTGTHSYTPLLTLLSSVPLWRDGLLIEGRRVSTTELRQYCMQLCRWARHMLVATWHTHTLCVWDGQDGHSDRSTATAAAESDERDEMYACMATVALGFGDGVAVLNERLQDVLYSEWRIECPVKNIEGLLYVRISCHVYNRPEDYLHLAHAILSIREQYHTQQPEANGAG